jgi:TRAP-type C4-dicarboxylate transport system substrate-binding protein
MHRIIVLLIAAALSLPAAAQQKQNWKMANVVPEGSWFGKQHKWWVVEVEKRSGERIKV